MNNPVLLKDSEIKQLMETYGAPDSLSLHQLILQVQNMVLQANHVGTWVKSTRTPASCHPERAEPARVCDLTDCRLRYNNDSH